MLVDFKQDMKEQAALLDKAIPSRLLDELDRFEYGENTITTHFACNLSHRRESLRVEWIGTKWEVTPHRDPMFPKWCYFLIVRNPGYYIGTVKNYPIVRQVVNNKPGAVLGLNIHEMHWLGVKEFRPMDDPRWIALSISSMRSLSSAVVMRLFNEAIKTVLA